MVYNPEKLNQETEKPKDMQMPEQERAAVLRADDATRKAEQFKDAAIEAEKKKIEKSFLGVHYGWQSQKEGAKKIAKVAGAGAAIPAVAATEVLSVTFKTLKIIGKKAFSEISKLIGGGDFFKEVKEMWKEFSSKGKKESK